MWAKRRTYWLTLNIVGIGFLLWFVAKFGQFHRLPLASPDEFAGISVMPFAFIPVAGLALVINFIALIAFARSTRPQAKRDALKLYAWLSVAWLSITGLCIAGI